MKNATQVSIPTLVRIKDGALDRIGIYAQRHHHKHVILLHSHDLLDDLVQRVLQSLRQRGITVVETIPIANNRFEETQRIFVSMHGKLDLIVGLGGGKALDVSKYVAFQSKTPYVAMPTSLSNDGFCSPQSSLTINQRRRSLPAAMPYGIVIDTEVCMHAPRILWFSGIGDLVSKLTAVYDWKLAFKERGTIVDDFAALLSDATVYQFLAHPEHTVEGIRLLGSALMLNGIAMEICGSSRPASGSEHLISHALDATAEKPVLHGLQVGIATYIVSQLQKQNTERIADLFDKTGFWQQIQESPLSTEDWLRAVRIAPDIKSDYYTILSERDWTSEIEHIIRTDPKLNGCFS